MPTGRLARVPLEVRGRIVLLSIEARAVIVADSRKAGAEVAIKPSLERRRCRYQGGESGEKIEGFSELPPQVHSNLVPRLKASFKRMAAAASLTQRKELRPVTDRGRCQQDSVRLGLQEGQSRPCRDLAFNQVQGLSLQSN